MFWGTIETLSDVELSPHKTCMKVQRLYRTLNGKVTAFSCNKGAHLNRDTIEFNLSVPRIQGCHENAL